MKKFNILQFVRAIIFLSRGAVCYKLCRNLFLLFLTLFFIQRKNDNQPVTVEAADAEQENRRKIPIGN